MTPLCECQKSPKIMVLLILVIFLFFFFLFLHFIIKLPKAGSLCVKGTPLLMIFDVYLIRFMVISTAQLHSTKSYISFGAGSSPAGCVSDVYNCDNL